MGINVIDTSSHFGSGEAEKVIGKSLRELVEQGFNRDEFVICSKAGFIFNQSNIPKSVPIKPNNYHCISPAFLESEISSSLERLQLESLDLFLLNNPERMLQCLNKSVGHERLYDLIYTAMDHLEKEVERGRISGYGIASNSMPVKTATDYISLERIMSVNPKHFVALQYPFNIFERNGIESGFDGSPSLDEQCREYDMYQMTQRPFNAITSQGVCKLVTKPTAVDEHSINQIATDQFTLVTEMEIDFSSQLGLDTKSLGMISKFVIAQILAENLSRLVENGMAAELYIQRDILPTLNSDLKELYEFAQEVDPELRDYITEWGPEYKKQVEKLTKCVLEISSWHANRSNQELNQMISLNAHRNESLAVNALSASLSALPHATTLSGMKSTDQLDNVHRAIKLGPIAPEKLDFLFHSPFLR
jgi:aryl-alcohol dehydrogenase-like predicted oxidoreductase